MRDQKEKKEQWLQEHETINQRIEKMIIQILLMKNMLAREELRRHKAKQEKEEVVMEVFALQKEWLKPNQKLDNLVEKNKDLDPLYVNNKLEEYDELVQCYSILHTKQQMDDSNVKPNEWWELT